MKSKLTFLFFVCLSFSALAQWKTTNGLYSGEIHSIIISNNEIIVGTNIIYKSADNGATWHISNNGISNNVGFIRSFIKDSIFLFAATNKGVFYSTDNGNNWTICNGTASLDVWSIKLKGSKIFISTGHNAVYKSIDHGISWSPSGSGLPGTPYTWMRMLLVKGNDLYVATDDYGIYKSTNDGLNWTAVNTGLPGNYDDISSLALIGDTIFAGTYLGGMYKSINNGGSWFPINNGIPSDALIMGIGINGTSLYASTFTGYLYKSTDYTNWIQVPIGNPINTRFEAFYSSDSAFYVGSWGMGNLESSYGIFKSINNGASWRQIGIPNFPVTILEVTGNNIFGVATDTSGNSAHPSIYKTKETDSVWHTSFGGMTWKNVTALESQGALVYLFNWGSPSQAYQSINYGNAWLSTGYNLIYNKFNSFAITGSLVYGCDDSIYVTADDGATWNLVNNGIPSTVQHIYDLTSKGTLIFAATGDGIYKNTIGANSWTAVNNGLTNPVIKSIYVSGSIIYAGTLGGGIFTSVNDGGLWSAANTGIPSNTTATSFASSAGNVFAGTDKGVFSTSDDGNSWTNINTGLPDSSVTSLAVSTNYLWAGTNSQGVWRIELAQIITGINDNDKSDMINIFPNPATDNITLKAFQKSEIEILNIEGQILKSFTTTENYTILDISDFARGMYFVKVKAKNGFAMKKFIKE